MPTVTPSTFASRVIRRVWAGERARTSGSESDGLGGPGRPGGAVTDGAVQRPVRALP